MSEALQTPLKDPATPLLVNPVLLRAGQRGDNVHLLLGQKSRQVLHPGFIEDREIATIDHLNVQFSGRADQGAEPWMQLRRPSRKVQRLDSVVAKNLRNQGDLVIRHHLGPPGACVHMAMAAALIAAVSQIHLEGPEIGSRQFGKDRGGEGLHHGSIHCAELISVAAGRQTAV